MCDTTWKFLTDGTLVKKAKEEMENSSHKERFSVERAKQIGKVNLFSQILMNGER